MAISASFPVVFFDGERETDIGDIAVYPSTGYGDFMAHIAQRIGISPQQIAVSFNLRHKKKVLIDDYTNFADILPEKDGVFQAVLKRSHARRGRRRHSSSSSSSSAAANQQPNLFPPEKVLLRRDRNRAPSSDFGRISPPALGLMDLERLLELQRQKELYLLSTNPYVFAPLDDRYASPVVVGGDHRGTGGVTVCELCLTSNERPVPFHSCVYDTVTEGFRSTAGPVQRPPKTPPAGRAK